MHRCAILAALLIASFQALAQPAASPRTWIDPDTGHRVVRLTDEPGSASLYFNQNGYTADGSEMVYTTPDGISVLDLATHAAKSVVTGTRPRDRHRPQDAERLLHQGRRRLSRPMPIPARPARSQAAADAASVVTVNADETLLAGTYIEGERRRTTTPTARKQPQQLDQPVNKGQMMEERLAAHLPMALFTINTQTGETKVHSPRHRLAQSPGVFAHRSHPADVLPRRPLAQSGPHLDHAHRRLAHHADPHTAP